MIDRIKARAVAEGLLATSAADSSAIWLELAEVERDRGGGVEKARAVYRRACQHLTEPAHAAALHDAWRRFEERNGSLRELQAAEAKGTERMAGLMRKQQLQHERARPLRPGRKLGST